MGLSSQLAPSAIARPGVCTSSTRPASPYQGQVIFETDTNNMKYWSGSAWVNAMSAPTGVIEAYAGSTAPTGWLLCAGQAVSRTTYADLFAIVSTTYGSGDGSTTFNLPDLRGRAPFGKDDMNGSAASRITSGVSGITGTTLGAAGGDQNLHSHTHTQNAHTHTQDAHGHNLQYGGSLGSTTNGRELWGDWNGGGSGTANIVPSKTTGVNAVANASYVTSTTATNQNTTATNNSTGSGNSQNMPPALILNYIIRT